MPSSKGWRSRRDERTRKETPIGEIVTGLLRERAFAGGVSVGRLATSWPDVVGPRLAAETAPVSLEGRTLVVAATAGAWGAQARFLAEEIRKQANLALGADEVARVQVVVRYDPRKGL